MSLRTLGDAMTSGRYAAWLLAATALVAVTRPSRAQTAGDGFLFRSPQFTWGIHGGFDRALASSDVFSFVTKQLTLSRGDFSSATFGSSLAVPVSRSNDVVIDVSYASVAHRSEFRGWVDQNNLPIEQTSQFDMVINMKSAQSFGLPVPDALLARATHVVTRPPSGSTW